MKHTLDVAIREPVILQNTDIPYAARRCWCGSATQVLTYSLLLPRRYFPYDEPIDARSLPLIVWICGGAFSEMNANVWLPELTFYAKHGFAVASVTYSTSARTRWPQQIIDVKEAIRVLRARADEYGYNADKIAVMGESAGGYLAALAGTTGGTRVYDAGQCLDHSSAVQAAVPYYPLIDVHAPDVDPAAVNLPKDILSFANPCDTITEDAPPFLIFHGDRDGQVAFTHGEALHDALAAKGVPAELYQVQGADHAAAQFFQPEVKQLILEFLNTTLRG